MVLNLSSIKKGEIVLLVVSAQKYLSVSLNVLKHYCNDKKSSCVYVSVNRNYSNLVSLLKQKKINTNKMFIIDAITPPSGQDKNSSNAIFVGSPKGLTDISISASAAINALKGEKIVFFDTLSTLLTYNDAGTIAKFAHFLVNKMKDWDASGIIISLEKETDERLKSQLSQFVDRVIEVK